MTASRAASSVNVTVSRGIATGACGFAPFTCTTVPFPGVIAISLHTIAALGKLYSEVIEGIDPGPLEAVRAEKALRAAWPEERPAPAVS